MHSTDGFGVTSSHRVGGGFVQGRGSHVNCIDWKSDERLECFCEWVDKVCIVRSY